MINIINANIDIKSLFKDVFIAKLIINISKKINITDIKEKMGSIFLILLIFTTYELSESSDSNYFKCKTIIYLL